MGQRKFLPKKCGSKQIFYQFFSSQNQKHRSNVICMLVKEFLEHVKLFDIWTYRQEVVKEQNNGYKCKSSV